MSNGFRELIARLRRMAAGITEVSEAIHGAKSAEDLASKLGAERDLLPQVPLMTREDAERAASDEEFLAAKRKAAMLTKAIARKITK